jgi:hypothetical protein
MMSKQEENPMLDNITNDAIATAVRNIFFPDSLFERVRNSVYGYKGLIDGKKVGVVAATKSHRFTDSPHHLLNKNDFDKLIAALDDEPARLDQGFVVSANIDNSGKPTFVDAIEARELAATLANVTPRSGGPLGDFWLVNSHFTTDEEDF